MRGTTGVGWAFGGSFSIPCRSSSSLTALRSVFLSREDAGKAAFDLPGRSFSSVRSDRLGQAESGSNRPRKGVIGRVMRQDRPGGLGSAEEARGEG